MLITYLNFYLVFIIVSALLLGLIVLKFRVRAISVFILWLLLFVVVPALGGYLYQIYFNSLPEVTVPDLTRIPFELAKERCEIFGLRVREAGSISETELPQGYVISQRAEPGRKVKVGRTINLILSSREEVSTPEGDLP